MQLLLLDYVVDQEEALEVGVIDEIFTKRSDKDTAEDNKDGLGTQAKD